MTTRHIYARCCRSHMQHRRGGFTMSQEMNPKALRAVAIIVAAVVFAAAATPFLQMAATVMA